MAAHTPAAARSATTAATAIQVRAPRFFRAAGVGSAAATLRLTAVVSPNRDAQLHVTPKVPGVVRAIGKQLGEENLRRFLVGPKECEITGVAETPDGKALFINIQHPGEDTRPDFATGSFGSHWPDGGLSRPRSATIVITREDGGKIGV